jgi:single-strand DNA-binding protein
LATNRSWTPTDGTERQEETEFHRVVAWAKLAEICSQLLHKGRKVYVEGRLQTRKWQTSEGLDRETTEVVISDMIALGPPKGGMTSNYSDNVTAEEPEEETQDLTAENEPEEKAEAEPNPKSSKDKSNDEEVSADDIPF